MSAHFELLRFVPRNHLSFICGKMAGMPIPRSWRRPLISRFSAMIGARLDESAMPPEEFRSIREFFIRPLRAGARPIGQGIVSPADGLMSEAGDVGGGTLVQAKGKQYEVSALLGSAEEARKFLGGSYCTIYLAPKDYHRVHFPADGLVTAIAYLPGDLWPVNQWSIGRIENLFGVNERVVVHLSTACGPMAIVLVGATNVGAIDLSFDTLRTNQYPFSGRGRAECGFERSYPEPKKVRRGEELGVFLLGSTVILLVGAEAGSLAVNRRGTQVRMGESIGSLGAGVSAPLEAGGEVASDG